VVVYWDPVGSYLMCFRFVQVAVAFYRTGRAATPTEPRRGGRAIPEEVLVEAGVEAGRGTCGRRWCDEHRRDHASSRPKPEARHRPWRHHHMAMPLLLITLWLRQYFHSSRSRRAARRHHLVLLIDADHRDADLDRARLTVLIFIFTMTDVPIDAVALSCSPASRSSRYGDPVLHPGGKFPTHGRRPRRMIRFRTSLNRPLARGWRSPASSPCAMFALVSDRASRRGGDRIDSSAPMVKAGYPMRFERRA